MLLKPETYKLQSQFAMYCRSGKVVHLKGARPERLRHYRRLVFNVIKDALQTAYPIAYKYIPKESWDSMVENYFSSHHCSDPQVWRMPREFYQFSLDENYAEKYELPFLNELLYFEWLEVELYMMEDLQYPDLKSMDFDLHSLIAVNPEYRIIKLSYPVHLERPYDSIEKKRDYFLLLFREKKSGRIQFTDLSVLYAYLLENLIPGEKALQNVLNDILYVFGINDLKALQSNVFAFLEDLQKRGFVLGALES